MKFHKRRAVRALRANARRQAGRAGALNHLQELQRRVIDSGQRFYNIPGHELIATAVKIERRRARVRNRTVAIFGLHRRTEISD